MAWDSLVFLRQYWVQKHTISLLAFNIGVEVAQILVVLVVLLMNYIFNKLFSIKHRF